MGRPKTQGTPNFSEPDPSGVQAMHELRRRYPRVPVGEPARVVLRDGSRAAVTLHDVSPDAIQIRCDRKTAHALHPSGRYVTPENAPTLYVELRLPSTVTATEVVVPCRMTYFAMHAADRVAFGLVFDAPGDAVRRIIDQFIASALVPARERGRPAPLEDSEAAIRDADSQIEEWLALVAG